MGRRLKNRRIEMMMKKMMSGRLRGNVKRKKVMR